MKKPIILVTSLAIIVLVSAAIFGYFQQSRLTKKCQPPGKIIAVNENTIHYLEREGGEIPVVFLHGASSNSREWKESLFQHIPNYFKLVAIDRPGLGHSKREPGTHLLKQVELIHSTIQKLQLVQPILVVHSLSGVIGARLLTNFPGYYKGLIIIAGATYPIGDGSTWYTKLATFPLLGQIFRTAIVPVLAPMLTPELVKTSFYPELPVSEYASKTCVELLFAPDRFLANAEDLNQIRSFLDESYPLYSTIRGPVSLIYGAEDQVIYQYSHAGGFKFKVPQAKYIMLPDTGHLPHYYHQKIVRQEIIRIHSYTSQRDSNLD